MKTFIPILIFACLLAFGNHTSAAAKANLKKSAQTLKGDTTYDNINNYMRAHYAEFQRLYQSDLDAAEAMIDKMEKDLGSVTGADKKAADYLKRFGTSFFRAQRTRVEHARVPEADLLPALEKNPNDSRMLTIYHGRRYTEIATGARSEPEEAAAKLKALRAFYADLKERGNDATDKRIDSYLRVLERVDSSIEAGRKMAKVIGMKAAPLNIEAWANGDSLTDADLKGKVVLLDFWAVWCGPCIATFPHLNEWNEKYADKGLVTIGLTRWYNYAWKNGKAARSKDVPHEEELEMLEKFGAQHKLTHRFAIQKDRSMSDFYGVRGIPHAVLIDRRGKVALMRVGSGEANAKAISEKLAELIAEKP